MTRVKTFNGTVTDALKTMPDNYVDAIFSMPGHVPYAGLHPRETYAELLCALRHGGYLLNIGEHQLLYRLLPLLEDTGYEVAMTTPRLREIGFKEDNTWNSSGEYVPCLLAQKFQLDPSYRMPLSKPCKSRDEEFPTVFPPLDVPPFFVRGAPSLSSAVCEIHPYYPDFTSGSSLELMRYLSAALLPSKYRSGPTRLLLPFAKNKPTLLLAACDSGWDEVIVPTA